MTARAEDEQTPLTAIEGCDVGEHPGYRVMLSDALAAHRTGDAKQYSTLAKTVFYIFLIFYFESVWRMVQRSQ